MLQRMLFSFFTKHPMSRQFRYLFIIIVIFPLLLVGIISSILYTRELVTSYEHLSHTKASQIRSVFSTTCADIQGIYTWFCQDENLHAIFSEPAEDVSSLHSALYRYDGFREMAGRTAAVSEIRLYLDSSLLHSKQAVSSFYPLTDADKESDWYSLVKTVSAPVWKAELRTQRGVTYHELNYYASIPLPQNQSKAVLMITISSSYLWNLLKDAHYTIAVNIDEGPVFFSNHVDFLWNSFPVFTDESYYYEETGSMKIAGKSQVASVLTMRPASSQNRFHILVYDPEAFHGIIRLIVFFICAILLILFLCAIIFYVFTKYSTQRILTLRRAMHNAANNNHEIPDNVPGDDELSETFQDLKKAVAILRKNEAQLYEAQLQEQRLRSEQKETELMLLTSQMNPHFLYNTLEMLRMKALSDGSREVANAIRLLGKNMRYVLGTTRTSATTLDRELDYVISYLSIMKMRFDERLTWNIEVDDRLSPPQIQILPLLIQPLAENAILHGIEESGLPGKVDILIREDTGGPALFIDVKDNGKGMSGEELNRLSENLSGQKPENVSHGVGLYNVHYRIRLYYGLPYGITLKSAPGRGTTVTIRIPLREGAIL